MVKAVALFSGGLDSQLAVKLIQEQGIEVIALNFTNPFFGGSSAVKKAAENLGIPLHSIDFSEQYLPLLKNPRYGFGKNLNPCIDCHGLMLKLAGQYMEQIGADFIITGEVLKQRPKSQHRDALHIVEKLSGYSGRILRPLSAQLLPPTEPELTGLVDRERLLALSGRTRKPQMELAKKYGVVDYPSPAGGCLLTLPSFSERLRKFLSLRPNPSALELERLKTGRHFFGPEGFYLIIGRKHEENLALHKSARPGELLFKESIHPGPTSLLSKLNGSPVTENEMRLAAALTARYSDARSLEEAKVKCWEADSEPEILRVKPTDPAEVVGLEHY